MTGSNRMTPVPSPHALPASAVIEVLGSHPQHGLSDAEAGSRLATYGPNALSEAPRPGIFRMFLAQFKDFVVILLIVAAGIAAVVGYFRQEGYIDSIAIVAIVMLNALIGVIQERKAEQSLAALQAMAAPEAAVVRSGRRGSVPAEAVVPGDLVVLETGNFVPADLRLVEAANLQIEEAPLTGESLPVRKSADVVLPEAAGVGDRENMAYRGTVVTYGRGMGVASATGMATQIGQIAALIQSYEREPTPLQERLDALGKQLGVLTLGVCAVVFLVQLARETPVRLLFSQPSAYFGQNIHHILDIFMTAVSLAIAAVPEGLPAVVTVALAIGVQRMIRRHALVRRLPAVETLGSATTICSDKTGTLTQNEMMVVQVELAGHTLTVVGKGHEPTAEISEDGQVVAVKAGLDADLGLLAMGATLCSDALVQSEGERWIVVGDPTEGALVTFARRVGLSRTAILESLPRVAELPFDSTRKRMTTCHEVRAVAGLTLPDVRVGQVIAFVKGAPDSMLANSVRYEHDEVPRPLDEAMLRRVEAANTSMAASALRVLAVAYRVLDKLPDPADLTPEWLETDLTFIGLLGMIDPPRPEAKAAIERARLAGIRTVMITGDYAETAVAIAREIGLLAMTSRGPDVLTGQAPSSRGLDVLTGAELELMSDPVLRERAADVSVYARVSPEHKVRIVEALKAGGEIVAMTGDGVNDAPALKRAHIGVAMGRGGTDVSRETADMVLTDDNFASIVAAVEEGRTIYANIRKFVFYLLSCNIGEILIIFVAVLLGFPPPLLPIHLLWLNFVTDGLPALALGMEAAEPDVMQRPPRDPGKPIVSRDLWPAILVQSVVDAGATLGVFFLSYHGPASAGYAQTMAFATLVTGELLRAYTSRSERESVFRLGVFSNRWMVLATASSFLLLICALYAPGFREVFQTVILTAADWRIVLVAALMPATGAELFKAWRRRHTPD